MDHQHWRRRRCTLIKVVHLHTTQIMPLGSEGIKRLPGHFEIGVKRIKLRCPARLPFAVMECPEIASIPRQLFPSQWHPPNGAFWLTLVNRCGRRLLFPEIDGSFVIRLHLFPAFWILSGKDLGLARDPLGKKICC